MTTQPTILLTFAQNDLRQVAEEAQNLKAIVSQQKVLQYRFIENVSAGTLENAVTEHGKAFAFFHFSGHANETGLMLSDENYLNSGRLYRILFGKSEQLQFVFLNGCRSYGHAGYLIASGVKAVLIANTDVPDEIARQLAERFYELFLLKGCALGEAFKRAEASVNSGYLPHIVHTNPAELLVGETAPSQWSLLIYDKFSEAEHWTIHDFLVAFQKRPVEPPYVPFFIGLYHDNLLRTVKPEVIINAMFDFAQRSDYEQTILNQLAILPPQNIAYQTLLDLLQPSKVGVFETLLLQLQLKGWILFDPNKGFRVNPVLQAAARAQQQLINLINNGKYEEVLSEIKSLQLNDKAFDQFSSILEKARKQAESKKYYKKNNDIQQESQASSATNHFEPPTGKNSFMGQIKLIDWKLVVFVSTFMVVIGTFIKAITSSPSNIGASRDPANNPSGKPTVRTPIKPEAPQPAPKKVTKPSDPKGGEIGNQATKPSDTKVEKAENPTNEKPKPSNQTVKETDCMLTAGWHTILRSEAELPASELIQLPENQKFKILDKKIYDHGGLSKIVFYKVEHDGYTGWVRHNTNLNISAKCYNQQQF